MSRCPRCNGAWMPARRCSPHGAASWIAWRATACRRRRACVICGPRGRWRRWSSHTEDESQGEGHMTIRTWVIGRVNRMNRVVSRADLPPREAAYDDPLEDLNAGARHAPRGARAHEQDETLSSAAHLGVYGPMIGAIRAELEHFIVSHVRLHLAIADRDRFLLTSVGVRCTGTGEARDLLRQFMQEFKPEQVKRYLIREVISGLPNAAVMDLSQFAGLVDVDA